MPKCIYREVDLNFNNPPDADTASLEHIIPWAIGGSNGVVTNDVSKMANNDLGSDVDAPFSNTLPIAIKRHQFQLKGQGGTIPPIVWSGESVEGIGGTLTISADGKAAVSLDKSVQRPAKGEAGPILVTGSRDDLTPILSGMLKGMLKRGESAYSTGGQLLQSLDDFWNASQQKEVDKLKMKVEYFNHEAWARGILKIALAAGHRLLGPDWSFGSAAAMIRAMVIRPRVDWGPQVPRGFIAGELDASFRRVLGKTAEVRAANKHTVAVLPADGAGNGVLAISLFGGDGVPESLISIGKLSTAMIDALNRKDNESTLMGFRIDPKTRHAESILFGEIDERLKRHGPTNKKTRDLRD